MRSRIEKHGDWTGRIGENIGYGGTNGRGHMLQLYVDDGVYNRGHRDNILSPHFRMTGIAVCEHTRYDHMLVAVYATSIRPYN